MVETVRNFQEQLGKEPEQITDDSQRRHSEFDRMISDWVQTTPRLKPTKAGAQRGEEKVLARAAGGRRSD
jgi:hypothetical protein